MGVIIGKIVLVCPKTGREIEMHKACMNADAKGNSCPSFKHYGIQGSKPVVTCKAAS